MPRRGKSGEFVRQLFWRSWPGQVSRDAKSERVFEAPGLTREGQAKVTPAEAVNSGKRHFRSADQVSGADRRGSGTRSRINRKETERETPSGRCERPRVEEI